MDSASPQPPFLRGVLSPSPSRVPLPPSERSAASSRRGSTASNRTGLPSTASPAPVSVSPRTLLRPKLDRMGLSLASSMPGGMLSSIIGPSEDPFWEGATIAVNQPVGSLSISPNSRDVCLASRKGLYILDLKNLETAPRFVPQGGRWQIADCQWSPHAVTDNLILSTSSSKLLVWDLAAQVPLLHSVDAHERAITDINWHALNPQLLGTVAMDAGIRGWDLRMGMSKPFMRLSAWGAAGTQVKWNRRAEHILATAHGKDVLVWDERKGSLPVETLKAHDAKIYGIDWDRREPHQLVTCSLDKTIKQWYIPSLRTSSSSNDNHDRPDTSTPFTSQVISTNYPVWRARNLPFGYGILALPQRGETALEMFGINGNTTGEADPTTTPMERFEGSADVVKEFVWRVRGGNDQTQEDRDFQLVTWSKDRKLRVWPVPREVTERVGYKRGAPITVLMTRKGARDITFTNTPGAGAVCSRMPLPIVDNHTPAAPSGIARQRLLANSRAAAGMTRGGKRKNEIDQLEWLGKVVKTGKAANSDSGTGPPSRAPSVAGDSSNGSRSRSRTRLSNDAIRPLSLNRAPEMSRNTSNSESNDGPAETLLLKDEVLLVRKMFPKSKVNFEKADLTQRKLTMSLNGPWANGDRFAFIRIHWSFPPNYPYGNEIPTFELERNATVSSITRHRMVSTIKEIRANNKQCLVAVTEFLLGYHERTGRRVLDDDDMSDSDSPALEQNVPMLVRTTGAVFGPNGQLACFFPKHTVLPRARTSVSRSPSGRGDTRISPLVRAISALSRMENPHKGTRRIQYHHHARRLKAMMGQVQARSTLTLHNVSHLLPEPDLTLAALYVTTSVEVNLLHALEAKRLDHAEVWGSLRAILADPPPPYYEHAPFRRGNVLLEEQHRYERLRWERDMERKRCVLDELFSTLMEVGDIQLLALVSCILMEYERTAPRPPQTLSMIQHSPQQDYFVLPTTTGTAAAATPVTVGRRHSSMTPSTPPVFSSSGPSSFRTSGWSQILMNPSSISLRGMALTPRDRTSFDIPRTPKEDSDDTSPVTRVPGMTIPRHDSTSSWGGSIPKITSSPRRTDRPERRDSRTGRMRGPDSNSPQGVAPLSARDRSSSAEFGASGWSSISTRAPKVSFGSASPLRRAFSRPGMPTPAPLPSLYERRRRPKSCSVRIELVADDEPPPPSLLRREILPLAEVWKLAYADFLLRAGLVGRRTALLQYAFAPVDPSNTGRSPEAPSGDLGSQALVLAPMCTNCGDEPVLPGTERCERCGAKPGPTLCAACRTPIKGLATTCTICAHTSHLACLRKFLPGVGHCPACTCACVANNGLSGSFMTAPRAPSVSYGFSPSPERMYGALGGAGSALGMVGTANGDGGGLGLNVGQGHGSAYGFGGAPIRMLNFSQPPTRRGSPSPTGLVFDGPHAGTSPEQRRNTISAPGRSEEVHSDPEEGPQRRDTIVAPAPREGLLASRLRALGTDSILPW